MSEARFYGSDTSTTGVGHRKSLSSPVLRKFSITTSSSVSPSMKLPLVRRLSSFYRVRHRRRATLLALLTLVSLSLYVLFARSAPFSPQATVKETSEKLAHVPQPRPRHTEQRKQVQLDTAQELAAVSSFLASLLHNVIPASVDPSEPIDPQLILDFDTHGPRAEQEVRAMVRDVWTRNPVFLYSKLHSSVSREVKATLAKLNLRPAPTIIDVDVRDETNVLAPLLARLTGFQELPVLIVGGKVVGGATEIRDMEKSGELRELISSSGAIIDGAKRKKHH